MLFHLADGRRALRVFFRDSFARSNYAVNVQPDWPTMIMIVNKTTTGFTVRFSDPAPPEGGVVQVEGPVSQMYTTEEVIQGLSTQAWKRGVARAAANYQRAFTVQAMDVRTRERALGNYRRAMEQRLATGPYAEGTVEQRLVQQHLMESTASRQRRLLLSSRKQVKKKISSKDARLKALINASLG